MKKQLFDLCTELSYDGVGNVEHVIEFAKDYHRREAMITEIIQLDSDLIEPDYYTREELNGYITKVLETILSQKRNSLFPGIDQTRGFDSSTGSDVTKVASLGELVPLPEPPAPGIPQRSFL